MNLIAQQQSRNHNSDSEDTIASRFERQVASVPNKMAMVTDDVSLTYRALDHKASRIAAGLASLPSERHQPILLFMKDETGRIAAMLGAAKANRISVPLAPDSPEKWIAQIIEDAGTAQIIVDSSTRSIAEVAAAGRAAVIEVEQLARLLDPFVADRTSSPDDTAYILYTSGSTGRPKGVASSHRSLIRNCDVRNLVAELGNRERYANLLASGVSAWVRNSFSPLLSGECLYPFDLHHHGLQKLAPWLIAQKITYVSFSGFLLRTWLASLPDNIRFPALRFVGVRGERLYAQDVIRVARHLEGDWRIVHSYASTESGLIAAQVFTPSRLPDTGIVAAGHPVDGAEVFIKDETGAPVQPGEIGEVLVRSRFLAQGYWNNPDLTAKAFETDPFDPAVRTYRTGDLGRWQSDGMLEHMGRKGRRIKLRGYSIEPFEVECELMRQPGVTDAIVLLHQGAASEDPCLVGYVVAPLRASPSAIRKGLAECLPSYMAPSHIVVLDSFPVGSTGKIDRTALPTPYQKDTRPASLRAPSNDREQALLEIWQEVLEIPKIGIDDDFFELGGTSLQVLMLFAEIETRLGWSLPPTAIIQAPTIARLAEFVRTHQDLAVSQSLVPLRVSGTDLPLFLVSGRTLVAMFYRDLVNDLQSDRPVYGLQPPPLDGKHHIPQTTESMAAHYLTEIRTVQPHGPYFIAGHSFGGRLSFEMAQQLVREGERVSFLGLIDTTFIETSHEGLPLVSEAVRLTQKRRINGFKDLALRGLRFIKRELVFRRYDRWIRQGRSIPYEHRPAYHDRLCVRANRGYVHKPYPGHITIFSSAGNSERQRANWGPLARGGLTVIEVPAGHIDIVFPPNSRFLAKQIDACLSACVHTDQLASA